MMSARRGALVLLLVLAVWGVAGVFYRLGAAPLLDDPNEAEYAEVAREMLQTGDWITPQLNEVPFLNKPPLSFWMIALCDRVFGVNELAARVPSALAGLVIVLLVVWLGTTLYDAETGRLAGFVLLATGGFYLETRTVRPDLLLVAGIVGSFVACAYWRRAADGQTRGPLTALQVSLAVGLLAKGFLAVLIPGLAFAIVLALEGRVGLMRQLLQPRAWWLLALLVVPWHLAIALRHPGFLWDYVVNQHVLFFFDEKWPRDSVPVPLATFWAAFALRTFPWTIFVPLALLTGAQRARGGVEAFADRLVLAWAGIVLLLFSASAGRMEHYSIPALPAVALLVARLFRGYAGGASRGFSRLVTAHVVVFSALMLLGPLVLPAVVAAQEWLRPAADFASLARAVSALLAVGGSIAAVLALRGRRAAVPFVLVATFAAAIPLIARGLVLLAAVDSSAAMAAALRVLAEPGERIVYEAPVEYQSCAGFNFYLARTLDLLRPAGFVPPPYLEPHVAELFIERDELSRLWEEERVFFITDPLTPRAHLDGSVPEHAYVVARDSTRWVVTNQPLH